MVVSPLAFLVGAVARRSTWSLLLEVLPVWLLTMQSLVALSSQGDVDGRSSTPLFSRPVDALRTKLSSMRGQNSKLTDFLGRWTIQERHNIDEFLEGVAPHWRLSSFSLAWSRRGQEDSPSGRFA